MDNSKTTQNNVKVVSGYVPTKEVLDKAKQHGLLQGWSEGGG